MSETTNTQPSAAFWIIAVALLLWNLIGLMFYYMQVTMTPEAMAQNFNEAQVAWLMNEPAWATAAYATAVTSGVIAAVLMLLRKGLALAFFILSLLAVLVQDFNAFILSDWQNVWGQSALYLPSVVLLICIFEIWYVNRCKSNGWLT